MYYETKISGLECLAEHPINMEERGGERVGGSESMIILLLYSHTHDVEYYYIILFIMFLSDTMVITI